MAPHFILTDLRFKALLPLTRISLAFTCQPGLLGSWGAVSGFWAVGQPRTVDRTMLASHAAMLVSSRLQARRDRHKDRSGYHCDASLSGTCMPSLSQHLNWLDFEVSRAACVIFAPCAQLGCKLQGAGPL